jgi:hypothetical protein
MEEMGVQALLVWPTRGLLLLMPEVAAALDGALCGAAMIPQEARQTLCFHRGISDTGGSRVRDK